MKKDPLAFSVVIMAAGLGKRMFSSLPKTLHEVGGKPILFHILDQVMKVSSTARIAIVVGHGREKVEQVVKAEAKYKSLSIDFVLQPEQKGTGDAIRCAMQSKWADEVLKEKLPVLVLPGDCPLLTSSLIAEMVDAFPKNGALRLLTCEFGDPTGYGRIVRRGNTGPVLRIVEEKDATLREKALREVAVSIYAFQPQFLKTSLSKLSNKNAQGEYYLTDLVGLASRAKKLIDVLKWPKNEEVLGINNPWELALSNRILRERIVKEHALRGVRFMDPSSVWVDETVSIEQDVTIYPNVILQGNTSISKNSVIGPNSFLKNVRVESDVILKAGVIAEDSIISHGVKMGPYVNLRPGSMIGENSKIGNFVELKNSRLGSDTNVAHLSYLGDATVGSRVNIGCGFVTCNYDGRTIDGERKHKTIIGDDVFMGSDCQVIAPIEIGKGAYVASGSTLTSDVEPDALAIARAKQVNKQGYASRLLGKGKGE